MQFMQDSKKQWQFVPNSSFKKNENLRLNLLQVKKTEDDVEAVDIALIKVKEEFRGYVKLHLPRKEWTFTGMVNFF